jgi:hypothetical protein
MPVASLMRLPPSRMVTMRRRDTGALGYRAHGYVVCRVDDGTEDEGSSPRAPYGPVGYRGDHADGDQN